MNRPADAVVLGFTKSAELCRKSFAPLRQLKQEGVLRDIHYVTWSSPELDRFVEPVLAMNDVNIVRVPQPQVSHEFIERSVELQSANLAAALDLIEGNDTLVVKTRPDFIFTPDFLRNKIHNFDTLCAIPPETKAFGVDMPRPPFAMKIWLPWGDAGRPLHYAEMAFIGLKRDVSFLVTRDVSKWLAPFENPQDCNSIHHAVRFAPIFADRFPIFRRYLQECEVFLFDEYYRNINLQFMLGHPFFWCLVVANAWILHTAFHIDSGKQGDLSFYPGQQNRNADWSDMSKLQMSLAFRNIEEWTSPGNGQLMIPTVNRRYPCLVDDNWQRTMFTGQYSDFSMSTLKQCAALVASYPNEAIIKLEDEFYAQLWHWYDEYQAELKGDMDLDFVGMRIA